MMLKKICILSNYDAIRMFWLFVCAWLVEQVLSIGIEHLVWGDGFVHWFDVAFTACLFGFYALCANYLADSITVMVNGSSVCERDSETGQ